VLVADGTYKGAGNRNLDFKGKRITVKSENGPDKCIIDCERQGRGFYFHSLERDSSIVDGFTIVNGTFVGGIRGGGGIYCENSSPTIMNNTIRGSFLDAGGDGGGIYCENSSPTIINNTITNNRTGVGGGIYCVGSSPTIMNNTITDNSAIRYGGGILCGTGSPLIANNTITSNSAGEGGGIYCGTGKPTIINNVITGNVASRGGGIVVWGSSPTIINNTITGNSAINRGGGVYCGGSLAIITNTIVWDNQSSQGNEIYNEESTIKISYSLVLGGKTGIVVERGTVNWLDGNIDADPLFVDDSRNGDFHLKPDSPCIDAGTADGALLKIDIEGKPRSMGNGVDIGAYEYGDIPTPIKAKGKLPTLWGRLKAGD